MKLEIDLSDREEIEAAIPMLQLILDGTTRPAAFVPGGAVAHAPLSLVPPAPSTAVAIPPATAPVAAPGSLTAAPAPQPPAAPGPVAVVPSAPAALTPPAPVVDLDSTSLPWDERIHASTKSKIANGTWKGKRGVDAALVVAVEAELRAVAAQSANPFVNGQSPIAPPATVADSVSQTTAPQWPAAAPDGSLSPAQAFGGAAAPAPLPIAPPAAPLAPAAPAAPSESADPTTFEQIMPRVSAAVVARTIPATALGEACTANGLVSVVALQQNPAFTPMVWATLKQAYPALA